LGVSWKDAHVPYRQLIWGRVNPTSELQKWNRKGIAFAFGRSGAEVADESDPKALRLCAKLREETIEPKAELALGR
jgi:hypothetical protein